MGAQAVAIEGSQLFLVATTIRNLSHPASYVWTFNVINRLTTNAQTQTGAEVSGYPLSCPDMLLTVTAMEQGYPCSQMLSLSTKFLTENQQVPESKSFLNPKPNTRPIQLEP